MSRIALACFVLCFAVPEIQSGKYDPQCEGIPCVCYQDLGCFMTRSECGEDLQDEEETCANLPDALEDIATTFLLYDKGNCDEATELKRSHPDDIFIKAGFDTAKENKILVHGMKSPNLYGLLEHIKEQFFKMDKFNIWMVNWESNNDVGTVDKNKIEETYRKPNQNARVVGKELCMFLKHLHDNFKVGYEDMHLVGYNIGAHVCGYAGKCISEEEGKDVKIGRITALAPSAPFFEFKNGTVKPDQCRLDKEDAAFVDAIHADLPSQNKITLGMTSKIGHVDFYPNQGKDPQPGCKHMFCSHGRPMEFFEQSMKGICKFQSEPCTWEGSPKCPQDGCPVMGYNVDIKARGYYCVKVTNREPFC